MWTENVTPEPPKPEEPKSKWGDWFVSKKFTGNKSKLAKETSIVDRLKYNDIESDMAYRKKYYEAMGGSGKYTGTSTQNRWMLAQMKANGYAVGSRRINKDELAWTQENGQELIYRSKDGAMLTPLRSGDAVFTSEMTQRLWDMAKTPDIVGGLKTTLPHGLINSGANTDIQNDVVMNISLPNVVDGDSFLKVIQTDKRIEKTLEDMLIGKSLGRNSMNKYKY